MGKIHIYIMAGYWEYTKSYVGRKIEGQAKRKISKLGSQQDYRFINNASPVERRPAGFFLFV